MCVSICSFRHLRYGLFLLGRMDNLICMIVHNHSAKKVSVSFRNESELQFDIRIPLTVIGIIYCYTQDLVGYMQGFMVGRLDEEVNYQSRSKTGAIGCTFAPILHMATVRATWQSSSVRRRLVSQNSDDKIKTRKDTSLDEIK